MASTFYYKDYVRTQKLYFHGSVAALGYDDATLTQHGTNTTAVAHGTVTDHMILNSVHITAATTGKYIIGDLYYIETSAVSTGHIFAEKNYIVLNHSTGAVRGTYNQIDITATAAFNENIQAIKCGIDINAGVITGVGKICGLTVEVDVLAAVTSIANVIHGIEVDMRGIMKSTVGETIGIKVTMAGGSNYLDYGMQFSNCFSNAIAIIDFDLTQDDHDCVLLVEAGTHTITSFATFTGKTTYFADFNNSTDGSPFTKNATPKSGTHSGWISVLDQDGTIGYINVFTA